MAPNRSAAAVVARGEHRVGHLRERSGRDLKKITVSVWSRAGLWHNLGLARMAAGGHFDPTPYEVPIADWRGFVAPVENLPMQYLPQPRSPVEASTIRRNRAELTDHLAPHVGGRRDR